MPRVRIFPKRSRRVLVLGSGPAGLFAAAAAEEAGHVVQIFARGDKSPLYGAQYLHSFLPGLTLRPPERIAYILKGTAAGYRRKVYGPEAQLPVSPESLVGSGLAYDIRHAYDRAWERFGGRVNAVNITPAWLDSQGRMLGAQADAIIWSIPLEPQCIGPHGFASQQIWAQGDAPALGRFCSVTVEPWTVVCNGEDSPRWYRASNVFGHRTVEWPNGPKPPVDGIARVVKPLATNCNCWAELGGAPVLRVGRYGRWTKGELSHQAYERVRDWRLLA